MRRHVKLCRRLRNARPLNVIGWMLGKRFWVLLAPVSPSSSSLSPTHSHRHTYTPHHPQTPTPTHLCTETAIDGKTRPFRQPHCARTSDCTHTDQRSIHTDAHTTTIPPLLCSHSLSPSHKSSLSEKPLPCRTVGTRGCIAILPLLRPRSLTA